MKTNTFYKPKNEYNELLASQPYVNDADDKLREDFTNEIKRVDADIKKEIEDRETAIADEATTREEEDSKLHTKIETFNTIKVKWVNDERGTDKFESIDDYFFSVLSGITTEAEREQLKVELGQTIYIIEGKDDPENTFEEWVCRYPNNNFDTNNLPKMIRLGAVDSILARSVAPGSVKLVHEIYESTKKLPDNFESVEEYWAQFHVEKINEDGSIKKVPARGLAVAPCALEKFVEVDNEINNALNSEIQERKDADIKLTNDYIDADKEINFRIDTEVEALVAADDAIRERLVKIETEIEGSTVEDEQGFQDSRLDKIEAAIGMNHHHCDNCGCEHSHCTCNDDKCSCSDAKDKCTIYCRLNDAEDDLQVHMDTLESHNGRIETLETLTESHSTEIENLKAEDADIRTDFTNEVNRLDGRIGNAEENIENNKRYIQTVESILNEEKYRSIAEDNSLTVKIETESLARETSDNAIWSEIGEKTNAADGTIWKEIKEIQEEIGNQDEPYEDSIWMRIKNNKIVLDSEIARSTTADIEQVNRISALENSVEKITDEIGNKLSTDINIWHGIHTEINDRKRADSQLSTDIENALFSAKAYADELKIATLSEAADDAKDKADAAQSAAIESAVNVLRGEMVELEESCKEYTDGIAATTLNSAKDDASTKAAAAKDAAINAAINAAANAAANAKQYTDVEVEKLKDLCNGYTYIEIDKLSSTLSGNIAVAKQDAIDEANQNIEIAKEELRGEINSKVSNDVFEIYSQSIESILETKASVNDLTETNTKLTTVEKDLEDISHELHHLTSQTQFAVRTSLPGRGPKVIQFYNLIGPTSNEWDLVNITTVIANNDTIYPEIAYSGNIDEGKNDNRTVSITFEHDGDENLPVTLIVSVLKNIEGHIREID